MKPTTRLIAIILFSVAVSAATTAALTAPAEPRTRVETDQKTGALLFIVNGREEARITPDGLHIRQRVMHGGPLTHIGASNYDASIGGGHAQ